MRKILIQLTLCFLMLITDNVFSSLCLADDDTLTMAVFPRRSAKVTTDLFMPIANYLSTQLNRKVEFRTAKNFAAFWQGLAQNKYDLVHYNQYHYLMSHKRFGYRVILKNEEFGKSVISGSITIRKNGNINELADLRGKTIAFGGGTMAMMSYIVPTYLLQKAGLKRSDYEVKFAKTPPNAVLSVYYQQYDAAGAGDVVIDLNIITKQIDSQQLTHLITSKPLAHLPWAVNKNMSDTLMKKIQALLLLLNNSTKGLKLLDGANLTGLVKAIDSDYDPHRKIVKEVYGQTY